MSGTRTGNQQFSVCSTIVFLLLSVSQMVSAQRDLGFPRDIDWNADGTLMAIGYDRGSIQIIDTAGDILAQFDTDDLVVSLSWNPLNDHQLAYTTGNGGIRIIERETGQTIFSDKPYEEAGAVAWSPDGAQIAFVGYVGLGSVGR